MQQNQRVSAPYGDVYFVNTPSLDRLSQQLYVEQKQREAKQDAEAKALDDEFAKNMSGMRDADLPDYTQKYTDWKMATQNLMRMKNANSQDYIKAQLDVNKKKADIYGLANASKARMAEEKQIGQSLVSNPDNFDDNAHQYLSQSLKTPLKSLQSAPIVNADGTQSAIDLTDPNTYRYKGTDFDFSKLDKAAQGAEKPYWQPEQKANDLQFNQKSFTFGATPAQYYENTLGALAVHKAARAASAIVSHWSPELINTVQDQYLSIPQDKWNKIGAQPQDLTIKPDDTPAQVYAKHMAQLYFINNEPKEGETKWRTDEAAKQSQQQNFDLKKLAIQHANAKDLENHRHELTQGDKQLDGIWIDNYLDKAISEATSAPVKIDGKWQNTKDISLSPVLEKALVVNGSTADFARVLPNGKIVYGLYKRVQDPKTKQNVVQKDSNGTYAIDPESERVVSKDDIKLAMGKQSGVKQMNKEMSAGNKPVSQTKPTQQTGYTRSELKSAKWTDAQIDEAVKKSKIVVND